MSDLAVTYILADDTNIESNQVDGGAWRTGSGQAGGGFEYPDTVLSDEPFQSILKKAKM